MATLTIPLKDPIQIDGDIIPERVYRLALELGLKALIESGEVKLKEVRKAIEVEDTKAEVKRK